MPNAGTRSAGSVRRLAVGNPSVPPRWSPETTVPSTSTGRPSRGAEALEQREVAPPGAPEAERLARGDELGADAREVRARELLRLEAGNLRRELDYQGLL